MRRLSLIKGVPPIAMLLEGKVDKVKSFFDVVPLSEAQAEAAASAEADAAAPEGGRKSVRCCSASVYLI